MDRLISVLSANPIMSAVANVVALFTAAWALYRLFRFVLRFLQTVYRRSVRVAVWRLMKRTYLMSMTLASDIYIYVSFLVVRAVMIGGLALDYP
jgi:hypothetical protein